MPDIQTADAGDTGNVVRQRFHDDPSAPGLFHVPDQLVEVEGLRQRHGGDDQLRLATKGTP
jgi:hypothetical protein